MDPLSKQPLREKDIVCLGHLKGVFALLDRLPVGSERDKAANRELTFGGYTKLVLLYVWNPLINSLRRLQEAADLDNVAKALGVKRFSLGSFSEAPRAFDPDQLHKVIQELGAALGPLCDDPRLKEVKHAITLVDSTVLTALSRLAHSAAGTNARYNTSRAGRAVYGWRLHTQLDLKTFNALGIERTGARNGGEQRENNVLRRNLQADHCYVGDGGYADRSLFDAIVDANSSYVIRMREDSVFNVLKEQLLDDKALAAGVVRDAVVSFGTQDDDRPKGAGPHPVPPHPVPPHPVPPHPVRLVAVQVTLRPHPTRKDPKKQSDLILLATSLIDLPAELVALIYQYRYTVELFFRVFKQLLGLRHLISQREQGIDIQVYCTAIVCMLICLITGKKPNRSNQSMIGWYLIGLASEQELIAHLNKPDNTGVKLRAKEELFKKLGF